MVNLREPSSGQQCLQVTTWSLEFGGEFGLVWTRKLLLSHPNLDPRAQFLKSRLTLI